ncbi:hypothetical protein PYW07_000497 [Mythimna separata]|uniref:PEHE domain-containing protein n=1 Tax=Mythimna separata TaxID=271217 RepID=A0AAD7Z4J8_MYTSE|nr:hypothetical protein PYW07_000497 [Mythimna separata]
MNNRLDESNLVNLSGDLSALNQLDNKESLALSFPFDHIYACHSEESERQEHLDKEVEISTQPDDKEPGPAEEPTLEVHKLSEKLTAAEIQNTRLRHLLVCHLDLIQQQNELITKKEKQNTALKLENDSLKSKVTRMDRRITVSQRHNINPAPVLNLPPPNAPSTAKTETATSESQMVFNSLTEFLVPDVPPYLPADIGVPSILENTPLPCDNFSTMIENKRSYIKKEIKTEPRSEPLYTVTSNSGNTVIQKIQRSRRRTSGGIGSLSRLPKTQAVKAEPPDNVNMFEDDKSFERTFSVNKKSKMINTYGKSKTSTIPKKTPHYTGSLSDRLQLIDTTPTGEDPYQLGEADMREQSPIPKLMLQKTNHGRMKICSDLMGDSTLPPTRRIYDMPATETKMPTKIKLEKRYNLPNIIPYSAPQTTTHTSTYSTNTSTDTCTHMSTYTHVPKPPLMPKQAATLTPKQSSALNPKHTSTLTSTNACTHMSTYTHSTRTTTARGSASKTKTTKAANSRKSSQAASKKPANKASLPTPQTSPLTLTPLHVVPLMTTHTVTPGGLHAALTSSPAPLSSTSYTLPDVKKESLGSPSLESQLSPTNLFMQQPDLERIKKEPDLDWPFSYSTMHAAGTETSLCDFSYGENSNLTTLPALDVTDFRQLIESDAAAAAAVTALENIDSLDYSAAEKLDNEKSNQMANQVTSQMTNQMTSQMTNQMTDQMTNEMTNEMTNQMTKKRGARTTSLATPGEETPENRRGMGSKRGRKRALSSAGLGKNAKQNLSKTVGPKPRMGKGKAACRGKKSPPPGMMTSKPYHTLVGDPDNSWYVGLDPDVKPEDVDQGDPKASTVEVPRWREKPYTHLHNLEGTENLDDKIFEKRHQKLEAEERRQLRWHMRRIREQRHVERLRLRQRDPWYNNSNYQPSVYTIWPQPQRDVRMIEITDTIPVMAFGEDLPDLPPADFMLPWVRTSKPMKRSKRSKTLH